MNKQSHESIAEPLLRLVTLEVLLFSSESDSVGWGDDEGNIDTGVDSEVGDLFDDRGWAPHINDSLVDAHLVVVPGVGTVTAWGTARCDGEDLGWDAAWAGDLVALLLGTGNDLGAGVLEWLDLAAAEGHSDLVDVLLDFHLLLHVFLCHL